MSPESIAERVVRLEDQMTALQELPKKVDDLAVRVDDLSLQVSQLRAEMRSEFSAIREQFTAIGEQFAATNQGLATVTERLEQSRVEMRVLHEDVIARIAAMQNGRNVRDARGVREGARAHLLRPTWRQTATVAPRVTPMCALVTAGGQPAGSAARILRRGAR